MDVPGNQFGCHWTSLGVNGVNSLKGTRINAFDHSINGPPMHFRKSSASFIFYVTSSKFPPVFMVYDIKFDFKRI